MRSRKKARGAASEDSARSSPAPSASRRSSSSSSSSSSRSGPAAAATVVRQDPVPNISPRTDTQEAGAIDTKQELVNDETRALLDAACSLTKCTACSEVYRSPVTTKCGHTFCRLCFDRAVRAKSSCPECTAPLAPSDYVPNITLDNLAEDVMNLKTFVDQHYPLTAQIPVPSPVPEKEAALVGGTSHTGAREEVVAADHILTGHGCSPTQQHRAEGIPVEDANTITAVIEADTAAHNPELSRSLSTRMSISTTNTPEGDSPTSASSPDPWVPGSQSVSTMPDALPPRFPTRPKNVAPITSQSPLGPYRLTASPMLSSSSPTTGFPVVSSTYPDFFPADEGGDLEEGVESYRNNSESKVIVWSQRDDDSYDESDSGTRNNHIRNEDATRGAIVTEAAEAADEEEEEEWEESEQYIEQCLTQAAAAVLPPPAPSQEVDGDQATQVPNSSSNSNHLLMKSMSSSTDAASSSMMAHYETNVKFEPGTFTLSPEIDFMQPAEAVAHDLTPSQASGAASASVPPVVAAYNIESNPSSPIIGVGSGEYENDLNRTDALLPPPSNQKMMTYGDEERHNDGGSNYFSAHKGSSTASIDTFTPGYTLDPWAVEMHRELKKLRSALQYNDTPAPHNFESQSRDDEPIVEDAKNYESNSEYRFSASELNRSHSMPIPSQSPSTSTAAAEIAPPSHHMDEGILVMDAPEAKSAIRVAADALSPDAETSLEKCIQLGLFEYGDLTSFDGSQTSVFVVECKKEAGLRLCTRSVLYIKALCVGAFTVDAQWLSDCASSGMRIESLGEYEINGSSEDTVSGGPYKCRVAHRDLNGRMDLLQDVVFICDLLIEGPMHISAGDDSAAETVVSLSQLAWMVYFCGGDVMKKSEATALVKHTNVSALRRDIIYIRLYHDNSTRAAARAFQCPNHYSFAARSVAWFLNVVCTHSFDRNKYLK